MAGRRGSGELATEEAAARKERAAATAEKAAKHAKEHDEPAPTEVVEGRQDVLIVAGIDVRPDADVKKTAGELTERAVKVVAKAAGVESFAVTGDAQRLVLDLDGKGYVFTVQQALALRRLVNGAVINLNF
jgi:hypothetical protein